MADARRHPIGIRPMLLLVVAASVIPALIIILLSGAEQRRLALRSAELEANGLLSTVSERLHNALDTTRSLLIGLAAEDSLIALDPIASGPILQQVAAEHHLFNILVLARPDGTVVTSSNPQQTKGQNYADRRWFTEAVRRRDFAVGEYVISRITKQPTIHGAVPVHDAQMHTCGLVNAGIDLDRLRDLLGLDRLPSDISVVVTDHAGTVLVSVRDPARPGARDPLTSSLGRTAVPADIHDDQRRHLTVAVGLDGESDPVFRLRLGIPIERYEAEARASTHNNIVWFLAAAALASLIAWLLGGRLMARPVQRVAEVANAIAEGSRERRVGVVVGPSEVEHLARSFDRMADAQQVALHREWSLRTRFDRLFATMAQGVIYLDDHQCIEEVNPAAGELLRQSPAELRGKRLDGIGLSFVMHDGTDISAEDLPWGVAKRGNRPVLGVPVGFRSTGASATRWVLINAIPWQPQGTDRAHQVFLTVTDITELHQRTEELRDREQDLRITMQSIGDAVIATDAAGRVVRMNWVAESLTGWPERDALGKPLPEVFDIFNAQTRQPAANPVERVLATGRIVGLANHTMLRNRNGGERQIADSAAPIHHPTGHVVGVVLVFRDVTEQHLLEDQLRQSQKLDAIGQLAGGIAHDFNNLLTAIIGSAELLDRHLADQPEPHRSVRMIIDAAARAADLTSKLLSFARRSKRQETAVDLHREVESVAAILHRTIDQRIRITCDLQAVTGRIAGDPSLIQSAILNLALNARDAMPDGGALSFATRTVVAGDPELVANGLAAQSHVALSVTDTGCGIPDEVRARLFEPFVTTKPQGKGTGLGLPSVYGMVKAHHGAIAMQSEAGRGTTFTLYLPELEDASQVEAHGSGPVPAFSLNGRTVLVADDEASVREVLTMILRGVGADVVGVADGDEAVAAVLADPNRFHCAILDQVMPRRSGRDAYLAIHAACPDLPCFIASGYAHDAEVTALERQGLGGFLAKPFRRSDVIRLLAGRPSREIHNQPGPSPTSDPA